MTRRTQSRTTRWSDRPGHLDVVSPYSRVKPPVSDPRTTDRVAGPGPYEASYDIALGYGYDRSIILP